MAKISLLKKISHYAECVAVRFLRAVLSMMPLSWSSAMMGQLWRLLAPFNQRHQRVLRHIEWALGNQYSLKERQLIARQMWENLGRTFAEGMMLDRFLKDRSRFDIMNEAFVDGWRKDADGAIIATHHFGNWELASTATVLFSNKKLLGIYKRLKNPLVEALFLRIRAKAYPGGLYSAQANGAKRAVEYVRAGGDMAMVADLRDNNGVMIDFFDMPMCVNPFPAALARRYKRPLYAAQMRRVRGVNFKLDMVQINVPTTDNPRADIAAATQAVHTQFQKWIMLNPEQFMWGPYRWSGRLSDLEKPKKWSDYQKQQNLMSP